MEERKQKKPFPLPLIVLVVLLVVGGILTALLLKGPLASPENKAAASLEKTREQCKKLLKEERYEEVSALFDSVSEYPRAQAEIKRQLKDHMRAAVKDMDAKRIPAIYNAFPDHKDLFDAVYDAFFEAVDAIWEDPSNGDFPIIYQKLAQEGFYLEELDAYCLEAAYHALQTRYASDALSWIELLTHCEACMEQLQSFADELVNTYLEQGEYDKAQLLFSNLEYVGLKRENAAAMFLEAAYALMDRAEYTYAKELLQELEMTKQPIFDLNAKFTLRLAFQYIYIENGQFADAETYAKSFAGDTRERLMEVLLQHTADRGFIEAIEAAVLHRMDMEATGATWLEILDKELELLRPYRNAYFVDEDMKQLLVSYLDALTNQRKTLFWDQEGRQRYDAYYQWHLQEANRLQALARLAQDYDFGKEEEALQTLVGTEEGNRTHITAWKQIHDSLSAQLWDVEPYEKGGVACLDLVGETEYSFTLTCRVYRYASDRTLLEEFAAEPMTINPGETYRLSLGLLAGAGESLVIHWEITDIYLDGQLIG